MWAFILVYLLSVVREAGLPVRKMRMAESIAGQSDWTQFVHGRLEKTTDFLLFYPLEHHSRLQMMAAADAIIQIPEGISTIQIGQIIDG